MQKKIERYYKTDQRSERGVCFLVEISERTVDSGERNPSRPMIVESCVGPSMVTSHEIQL